MAYLGAPALFEDVDQALAGRALGQTAEVGAVALGGSVPSLQNQPQGLLGVRIGNPHAEKSEPRGEGFLGSFAPRVPSERTCTHA